MRKIIHVDMDAYYAAIEQRDFPHLRGKPVVVGGKPNSRGVVCTASYEARTFGVKSAMACAKAYRLCPSAFFVPPRFDVYKDVSLQIRAIFHEYTDLVEPLSLDEAYLDVTENKPNIPSATFIAREIRQRIFDETGLTASAGVGPSKFVAKIASDMNKPNGLTVIKPENVAEFMAGLPVGKFHGVGKATEEKLHQQGFFCGADICASDVQTMVFHFGKTGRWLFDIARGIDDRPVHPSWTRKSLGAEETFSHDLTDLESMKKSLADIAEEVQRRMEKGDLAGKTITLKVRYDNFERITRSKTVERFTREAAVLVRIAAELLETTEVLSRPVRLLGITVSSLNNEMHANKNGQLWLDFQPYHTEEMHDEIVAKYPL